MHPVNVAVSSFNPLNSYGRIACTLSDGLAAMGCHVNEIGAKKRSDVMQPVTGGICLGYPTLYPNSGVLVNAGKRLALTMFESTQLPEGWADVLNTCECVIVPASFLVDVFRSSGITVPIEVVPLGINPAFMHPVRRTLKDDEPLTFFALTDRGNRKNGYGAASAFYRAFGDDPRYRLLLKMRDKGQPAEIDNPNIDLIQADMKDAQLADLYRQCQVMLFPGRGEGFGLPPREFAATGGVVIATNWGGLADELTSWGIPLPYTLECAWHGHKWSGLLGEWANPDIDALSETMKQIAADFDRYADFGMQAAQFVQAHYQENVFVERVWSAYARYCC